MSEMSFHLYFLEFTEPCAAGFLCVPLCACTCVSLCAHTRSSNSTGCVNSKNGRLYKYRRNKQVSDQLQKDWAGFEMCPDLSLAFDIITWLESSSWVFLNFYVMRLHRALCIQRHIKIFNKNYLLKLSRRKRKDSDRVFGSISSLQLDPGRLGVLINIFPQNKSDGLELGPCHLCK